MISLDRISANLSISRSSQKPIKSYSKASSKDKDNLFFAQKQMPADFSLYYVLLNYSSQLNLSNKTSYQVMIRQLAKSIRLSARPFLHQSRYCYLTPIEKPVTSLAINSIVQLSTEMLSYSTIEYGLIPEISIFLGAFAFRAGIEILGLFFESLNLKKKDNWIYNWLQKIFIVDLRRDSTFYELRAKQYNHFVKFYSPQKLFSSFLKSYAILNLFRGCHNFIYSPQFQQLKKSSLMGLQSHDPLFLLPVVVIGASYLILSRSPHPFLIHLVRPENRLMCLNIAFMIGLMFVPAPSIYSIVYLGLATSHLTLRSIRNRSLIWKEYILQKMDIFRSKK